VVRTHAGPLGRRAQVSRTHAPVAQRPVAPCSHHGGCRFESGLAYWMTNVARAGSSAAEQPVDNGQVARSTRARRIADALVAQLDRAPVYETGR
jgi:hypothetical protein